MTGRRVSKLIKVHRGADRVFVTCPACGRAQGVPDPDVAEAVENISRRLSRIRNGPNGKGVRK